MARLRPNLIERFDAFADRVLDVVQAAGRKGCPGFVRDQLGRSGTGTGANVAEADESVSLAEFRHRLAIALRELGETRYWLRLIARRKWVPSQRLTLLQDEASQLARILATMLIRSDPASTDSNDRRGPAPGRPHAQQTANAPVPRGPSESEV